MQDAQQYMFHTGHPPLRQWVSELISSCHAPPNNTDVVITSGAVRTAVFVFCGARVSWPFTYRLRRRHLLALRSHNRGLQWHTAAHSHDSMRALFGFSLLRVARWCVCVFTFVCLGGASMRHVKGHAPQRRAKILNHATHQAALSASRVSSVLAGGRVYTTRR